MKKSKKSFRNYLKRNTNILTIYGIFNALAIYSSNLSFHTELPNVISIFFIVLSFMTIVPAINDVKYKPSFTTYIFKFILAICQVNIIMIVIQNCSLKMQIILIPTLIFIIGSIIGAIVFIKKIDKTKWYKNLTDNYKTIFLITYILPLLSILIWLFIITTNYMKDY